MPGGARACAVGTARSAESRLAILRAGGTRRSARRSPRAPRTSVDLDARKRQPPSAEASPRLPVWPTSTRKRRSRSGVALCEQRLSGRRGADRTARRGTVLITTPCPYLGQPEIGRSVEKRRFADGTTPCSRRPRSPSPSRSPLVMSRKPPTSFGCARSRRTETGSLSGSSRWQEARSRCARQPAQHWTVLTTVGPTCRSRYRAAAHAERKADDNTTDRV